ncbi:MAG: BrnT family toxin [Anaerolineales bacterium]|nr:BrnT family toxin [Anaerolineales bacterium]
MNVRYTLHSILFEWDSQKAAVNLRKHDVSFELACEAFFDPFVCYLDDEIVGSELRERIVGLTTSWIMLYIVYVMRDDRIRIVSARSATKAEREIYENQ